MKLVKDDKFIRRDESDMNSPKTWMIWSCCVDFLACIVLFIVTVVALVQGNFRQAIITGVVLALGLLWGIYVDSYNFNENLRYKLDNGVFVLEYDLNKTILGESRCTAKVSILRINRIKTGDSRVTVYGDIIIKQPRHNPKGAVKYVIPLKGFDRDLLLKTLGEV